MGLKVLSRSDISYGSGARLHVVSYGKKIKEQFMGRDVTRNKALHKELKVVFNGQVRDTFRCEGGFDACTVPIYRDRSRIFMILKIDEVLRLIDLSKPEKEIITSYVPRGWRMFQANSEFLAVVTGDNNLDIYSTSVGENTDRLCLTPKYRFPKNRFGDGRWVGVSWTGNVLTSMFAHVEDSVSNADVDRYQRKILKLTFRPEPEKVFEEITNLDPREMYHD